MLEETAFCCISDFELLQYFDQVTSYKLEGNEFVTWKMHLLCFKGCVTCKPELYACGLKLLQKIKGIRDAGSTADFRILFEVSKFKNLEI